MTEEKAKTRWCPMVRIRECGQDSPATNKRTDATFYVCMASGCMMWIHTDNESSPQPSNSSATLKFLPAGYCGLAKQ